MTLQEAYNENRKKYMANELTHEQFYLWLAKAINIAITDLPVSLERVTKSNDPHLNDIALHLWDDRDYIVRRKAAKAGLRAWSLSDTVCVLKNFARNEASHASR